MALITDSRQIPKHILDAAINDGLLGEFKVMPFQKAIFDSFEWLDEILLAVMAAGIPESCIKVIPPYQRKFHFGRSDITTEIQFIDRIN